METLNQISERIAYALDQPLNQFLKENIKFSVKYWRAILIRRDMERNGLSDEFLQRIDLPLTKVDKADACNFVLGCEQVLRTTNKVPKPIRVKNDILFKFVGSADGKPFGYSEYEELFYKGFNKYTSKWITYSYINEYLYIFNNIKLKSVRVQSAFSDPSEVNTACQGCYNDDMMFPIGTDMLQAIVSGILTGEFKMQQPPPDSEVSITPTGLQVK